MKNPWVKIKYKRTNFFFSCGLGNLMPLGVIHLKKDKGRHEKTFNTQN